MALTTAPVVAQVSRSAQQVQLRRLLQGATSTSYSWPAGLEHRVLASDDHDLSRVVRIFPQPVVLIHL